jgi:hypothetical protein
LTLFPAHHYDVRIFLVLLKDLKMSALYIVGLLGIPAAVATIISAYISYRGVTRKLYAEYELDQQKELRELMGAYTGRMLEAAIDWDRRMMQLYDYWHKPDPNVVRRKGYDPEFGWHIMCPGWNKLKPKWPNRVIETCPGWGDRLRRKRIAKTVARYRRDPGEYFYLSVVFRFVSLLAIARRFEAEAFYLDAQHAKNYKNELYFLRYAKSFLWAVTHSGLSPDDGVPARDHFLSDKLRPMLDLCYKDLGEFDSRAPKGEPIFDWDRFLFLIKPQSGPNKKYNSDMDRLLEFFDGLRPVDYITDGDGNILKRRRWERLICLHLLTLNFIETFGFEWQCDEARKSRVTAIEFLSMDNTVIRAFLDGAAEWLGLEDQDLMKSLREALEAEVRETRAIPDPEVIGRAVSRLIDKGARRVADGAVMLDKVAMLDKLGQRFTVDSDWLKDVQWRAKEWTGAATQPEP